MSQPKFISGPWERHDEIVYRVDPVDSSRIAFTCYVATATATKEEQEATATLITAAPDLYVGCSQSLDRLSDLPRFLRENGHTAIADIVAEVLTVQSLALAKARGEENTDGR